MNRQPGRIGDAVGRIPIRRCAGVSMPSPVTEANDCLRTRNRVSGRIRPDIG